MNVDTGRRRIVAARVLGAIVGVMMIVAAAGKIVDVGGFGELIVKYGLPALSILAPVVVAAEVLCGTMLLLWLWPRVVASVTALMLIAFTAAFFYANTWHGVSDCGCFGSLGPSAPAWLTYGRNTLLVASCVIVALWGKGRTGAWRWGVLSGVMVVSAFCIGMSFRVPSFYSGLLARRHPMIGLAADDAGLGRYLNISADSSYIFYLFSYDCPACIDNLANAMRYDDSTIADRFCGLTVNEDHDSAIHRIYNIRFEEVFVGDGLKGMIEEIPALLYVEHDTVQFVIEGNIPSEVSFRTFYLER